MVDFPKSKQAQKFEPFVHISCFSENRNLIYENKLPGQDLEFPIQQRLNAEKRRKYLSIM